MGESPCLQIIVPRVLVERGHDGVEAGVFAQRAVGGDGTAARGAAAAAGAQVILDAHTAETVQTGSGHGVAAQAEIESKV